MLKKLELGDTQEGSFKLPAFINLRSGFSSINDIRGEPQFSQKPLDTVDPALPVTLKFFKSPSMLRKLSGISKIVAFPLPVLF